jgi:hypothetical protein
MPHKQMVALLASPHDTLAQRFTADLRKRGMPVPPGVTAKLDR